MIFIIIIYLFIRKLYLLEVMLLDWLVTLKRNITNALLQMIYFQEVVNVSDMEYLVSFHVPSI